MLKKQNKKIKSLTILIVLAICFFGLPYFVFAATSTSKFDTLYFTPQIEIPNSGISGKTALSGNPDNDGVITSNLLGVYIKAIYSYGLSVAGILAAIVMMAGGILWLTSGGDSGQVSKAKSFIGGSIVGLFLLFGTYIILNTINPKLLEMEGIKTVMPSEQRFISCCHLQSGGVKTKIIKKIQGTTEVITVSDGPFAGKGFPGCENILQGSTQCAENSECKKYEKSVSAGTSTAGGTIYTKVTEYRCTNVASTPIPNVVIPNTTKTILCCGSKTGIYKTAVPNKFDVREENGKFFYVSGSNAGKEFTGCGPDEYQCTGNQKCLTLKKSNGTFAKSTNACFDEEVDEVVCFCNAYKKSNQTICEITKNSKECNALCTAEYKATGIIYSGVARPSEYFECSKDKNGYYDYFEIK